MKKLQLVTKILAVALIVAIAFIGIYVQKQNRMENIVKDYDLGMNLKGARVITLNVSDETKETIKDSNGNIIEEANKEEGANYTTETQPVNSEEVLTLDNYNKSKQVIEKRLDKLGVNDYTIKLEENSGKMIIEIPENNETDHIISNVSEVGKFEIVDSENKTKVLMNNSDIKKANVLYNTTESGTSVYLNIEFNKEGTNKLKDISTQYATVEENNTTSESTETNEEDQNKTKEEQKKITMQIDGSTMVTTSFPETMENGSIQLSMGTPSKDEKTLNDSIENATTISTLLDTGNLPIEYTIDGNEYIKAGYNMDTVMKVLVAVVAIIGVALIVLMIKYKKAGIIASISYIGMCAIYLLLVRYTNVTITLEGISAIVLIFVLNYIFNYKLLHQTKACEKDDVKDAIKHTYKDFFIKIIPICILSIVFCFISWTPIASFGMAMFWGLALMAIYNIIVSRELKRVLENK